MRKAHMKRFLTGLAALVLALGVFGAARADRTVTLTFTGDVTLGSEGINWDKPESFNGYVSREGYGWFFRNMLGLFSSDDLTLVNLEGVLSDSPLMEATNKTFRFRGPTDYAKILTRSSIEACAISNNHIMDFGRQGYESTTRTLKENGILFCGNDYYFVYEKDGIRIAFFALGSTYFFTYKSFVEQTLAALRQEGLNAVVVSFHAGQEYAARRRDRDQERFAQIAVEQWGADLVIMHHPHVLQGVDILNNRYVFYSLGNFCFGGNLFIRAQKNDPRIRTLESMALQMDLVFSDDGEYLGQQGRIYPCYISSSATGVNDPNDFQPKFVYGEQAQGVVDRIQADTKFDLGTVDRETGYLSLPFLNSTSDGTLTAAPSGTPYALTPGTETGTGTVVTTVTTVTTVRTDSEAGEEPTAAPDEETGTTDAEAGETGAETGTTDAEAGEEPTAAPAATPEAQVVVRTTVVTADPAEPTATPEPAETREAEPTEAPAETPETVIIVTTTRE